METKSTSSGAGREIERLCPDYVKKYLLFLPMSFGLVWVYKAEFKRFSKRIQKLCNPSFSDQSETIPCEADVAYGKK